MTETKEKKPKNPLYRKIVNVFIGFLSGLIILSLIFLGFSQTYTFREIVKDEIISLFNSSTNGKLNIERIDGTIITSLFLRNTSVVLLGDTLIAARNIEIKISPLQLLLRKLYFRKIELSDIHVNIHENEFGIWNLDALTKQTPQDSSAPPTEEPKSGGFYFAIQVNELKLNNLNIKYQTFPYLDSRNSYKVMNENDLQINNLNLDAAFLADLNKGRFNIFINHLSMAPNFDRFKLRDLSGKFEISRDYAEVKDFNITTDSSSINLNARLDNFNMFGSVELAEFKNYPLQFELNASPFNFDDLSSFIDATEILKGKTEVHIMANGLFGDFQIERLLVDYLNTHFDLSGRLQNLHTPENMYITAEMKDTYSNYADVNQLLPTLNLPRFDELKIQNFTANYQGEPTKFAATINGDIEKGHIKAYSFMDLQTEPIVYDAWFESTKADLFPIIGIHTIINSSGNIKGTGTNPQDLKTNFSFSVEDSKFNGYQIDSMFVESMADLKIINLITTAVINNSHSSINAKLDFNDIGAPTYDLNGTIEKLDLSKFLDYKAVESSLNFDFNFNGHHFDLDTLTGQFIIDMKNSVINNKKIDATHIDIKFSGNNESRSIVLESDIADMNVGGSFSINSAIDLMAYESAIIPEIFSDKALLVNPLHIFEDSTANVPNDVPLPSIINSKINLSYDFEFKDTELISAFFNLPKFEMLGNGDGKITNDSANFSISLNVDLDYILTSDDISTFYISDFIADIDLSRNNQSLSFDNLFGTLSVSGEKLYAGIEINNIFADLIFNEKKLFINAYAEAENSLKSEIDGYLTMSPYQQEIFLNNLWIEYKGTNWANTSPINILLEPDLLTIKDFSVKHDEAEINIAGTIINLGEQDLTLTLTNLPGNILTNYFLDAEAPLFKADIDLETHICGTFSNPVIDINLEADSMYYNLVNIGQLLCKVDYKNKMLTTDIVFLDSTENFQSPNLTASGIIPIDLSFENIEERLPKYDEVSLKILSENFDLRSLGDILPGVTNQTGYLTADVSVYGPYNNLTRSGNVKISDASFRALDNNLDYIFDLAISFDNGMLIVDKIDVSNKNSRPFPGHLSGSGYISFDGLAVENIDMNINGNLAILGKNSIYVSPSFYGNLFVKTNGNLIFSYKNQKPFLKGSINLIETDITYISEETVGAFHNNSFVYNILIDSTNIERKEMEFRRALSALQMDNRSESSFTKNFDAEIDINIVKDAKLQFILSKAANQKLIVEARGDFKYESINGISNVQGEINLLSGSKLEFIKTFEATGLIRFETDITDPYLDIIATYTAGYDAGNETGTTQDVAVKIKLQGPLSELGKNLANKPDNIAVYVGSRNIENNIADTRYDASDAFSFIFVGKFKEDLTTTDRNQVASQTAAINNTAASFLGSVLTSFLNSAIGDVINNIQLSQSGTLTKFSVSGKFENIRYKVGGTTQVFQDINKANLKLEYLFNPNFLIRLERKDPLVQSFGIDEKINELGLKYRFEF